MNNTLCGWLSPIGTLCPCGRREHRDKAYEIWDEYYPNEYCMSAYLELENKGWLHIGEDSMIMGDWSKTSEQQALFLLQHKNSQDEEFYNNVLDACHLGNHLDRDVYLDMQGKYSHE